MSVLELVGVRRAYRTGRSQVSALHDVDLTVRDGEYVAVVGPSGSGKSTLLHVMGALDRPTAGTVLLAGQDVTRLPDTALSRVRAVHLGFVFQQFFLLDGRTAEENVADGLLYQGVRRRERLRRAREALDRVGLGARATHTPAQLSGGECQRVAIARALVHRPRLLLADEPTGNLDQASGAAVLDLFASLHAGGATIVVVTHDARVADRLPRVVAVRDGRVEHDSGALR
ncbi:ABC transporter ATP-binding protein [Cellulomonas palmilytica]|uniref:ABC transporter ATP-binding protein n=1 Tax=Cellulomonas palmilytica TaxID=2608402 RepID=UPI001F17712A|nr:ABC transporter ATP-binding protein [Cellulomonas palmilytica]UJP40188.1 ABC transporter ATP-binding protein [Cellulomonas palmilytica]